VIEEVDVRIPHGRSLWTTRLSGDGRGCSQGAILDELRRVILDGGAPPGTTIPVDDVAGLFGVSRIPVREALKTLVGEGLVSQRPRSDYIVARLNRSELQEFYTVRGVLELATLAAAVLLADAEDDQHAIDAYHALERAVLDSDTRGHHRESRRFHFALLSPSRMDRTLHMLESAWNMTEPVQPMAHAGPIEGARFNTDHRAMLDAFIARDGAALIEATREHHVHLADLIASLPRHSGLFLDD
jgi:DNA-binding GntR family transcriptional regulator